MAPRARFELAANRLTADCSTTELPRNTSWRRYLAPSLYHDHIKLTIAEDFFVSGTKGMAKKHKVRLGRWHLPLPGSAILRIAIGCLLILGGCLGFLPILGFWMVPLGLVVLSIDLPAARRLQRRVEVWWGRRQADRAQARARPKEK